jgi:predicted transcriptional regulator
MSDCDFDLFGHPVRLPSGRRGRPRHVATQENRNKVIMLLALGWSNERIAGALHISQPTLRNYYSSELKARLIQRDRLDASRFMKVWEQVEAGNVGAMRLLDQMIAKSDTMAAAAKFKDAEKDEPVGKKESARREALKAQAQAEGWGSDLNPKEIH